MWFSLKITISVKLHNKYQYSEYRPDLPVLKGRTRNADCLYRLTTELFWCPLKLYTCVLLSFVGKNITQICTMDHFANLKTQNPTCQPLLKLHKHETEITYRFKNVENHSMYKLFY